LTREKCTDDHADLLTLSDSAEANHCNRRAEQVESEVCENTEQIVLKPGVSVGVHLTDRILEPVEEEWMRGSQSVRRSRLLHCQPEKGSLVISHQTKTRSSVRVVELSTSEIRRNSTAAVQADSPEVVGCERRVSVHNRGDAVQVEVLETHCASRIQSCSVGEVDATGIHETLSRLSRRVDARVRVEVLDVIERLHVVPEIDVAQDRCSHNCEEQCQCGEGVSARISLPLLCAACEEA